MRTGSFRINERATRNFSKRSNYGLSRSVYFPFIADIQLEPDSNSLYFFRDQGPRAACVTDRSKSCEPLLECFRTGKSNHLAFVAP